MGRSTVNFIPRPDAAFDAWVRQYAAAQAAWWAAQGLAPAALADFTRAYTAWLAAFPAHARARATAHAARVTKDQARADLERSLRPLVGVIQATPTTTDADRARLGITVRGPVGRASSPPSSRPLPIVESPARLTHTLRLVDESTPTRRAKPKGVQRAELFVALTPTNAPPPAPPSNGGGDGGGYRYLGSITDGTTTLTFDADKGGLQAHYLARWATRRGALGPWSPPTSATVAA